MIKKQLGVLAGSVMLATSANAALVGGNGLTDSSAVLVLSTAGNGAFIVDVTGQIGSDFSIDLTAATAALGGTIDQFALFQNIGGTSNVYSSALTGYIDVNGGVIYAGETAGTTLAGNDLVSTQSSIQSFIGGAAEGFNAEGTAGDLDGTSVGTAAFGTGLFTSSGSVANVYQQTLVDASDAVLSQVGAAGYTASIDGATFTASAVPVPAAAWLFGSALLGLGVVRRKKA